MGRNISPVFKKYHRYVFSILETGKEFAKASNTPEPLINFPFGKMEFAELLVKEQNLVKGYFTIGFVPGLLS